MNIYYQDDTATIYNDRMENIIDKLEFNYILTDPPYNIGFKYLDYKDKMSTDDYIGLFKKMSNHKTMIIHYPEAIINEVSKAFNKVNKIISWTYSNNASHKAHRVIAFFNCDPDFKKVRQPFKNPDDKRIKKLIEKQRQNNEPIGAKSYDWMNIQIVKNVSPEKHPQFTNQIPIELLERIILLTTNEGEIILDPFFGSGSLYFACKNTNRKCIGIEQSKEHLQCFKERLKKII